MKDKARAIVEKTRMNRERSFACGTSGISNCRLRVRWQATLVVRLLCMQHPPPFLTLPEMTRPFDCIYRGPSYPRTPSMEG
jgi:hypothetical protein